MLDYASSVPEWRADPRCRNQTQAQVAQAAMNRTGRTRAARKRLS